jgi:hypothetical protein
VWRGSDRWMAVEHYRDSLIEVNKLYLDPLASPVW